MKFKKNTFPVFISSCSLLGLGFVAFSAFDNNQIEKETKEVQVPIPVPEPTIDFGIVTDSFNMINGSIAKNEFLSTILERNGLSAVDIATIVKKSRPVFDVRKISAGNSYTILTPKGDSAKASYFIYQPNSIDYIVYDLRDSLRVYAEKHDVETRLESVAGEISNSLYVALQENGASPDLAVQLADIYSSTIDFHRINEGDWFKVEYERQYVKGQPVGQGKIQSAQFSHKGETYQSFYFKPEENEHGGYYDEKGNSLKRTFLKAPLKFSRISSRYTMRRFHPVQKIWKAHLGTDYAAPAGTPIIATANGVVVESSFTKGNGNYVKIKHDGSYATQYLHMSKRAAKVGQRVSQGQVIGYVGSTGLATGPHVCYRFWKNNNQVDPLKQKFTPSVPLADKHRSEFNKVVYEKQAILANIQLHEEKIFAAAAIDQSVNIGKETRL